MHEAAEQARRADSTVLVMVPIFHRVVWTGVLVPLRPNKRLLNPLLCVLTTGEDCSSWASEAPGAAWQTTRASTHQFLQAFLVFPCPHEGARREAGSGFFKSSGSSSSSESMRSCRAFEAVSDTVTVSAGAKLRRSHTVRVRSSPLPLQAGQHAQANHRREPERAVVRGLGTD